MEFSKHFQNTRQLQTGKRVDDLPRFPPTPETVIDLVFFPWKFFPQIKLNTVRGFIKNKAKVTRTAARFFQEGPWQLKQCFFLATFNPDISNVWDAEWNSKTFVRIKAYWKFSRAFRETFLFVSILTGQNLNHFVCTAEVQQIYHHQSTKTGLYKPLQFLFPRITLLFGSAFKIPIFWWHVVR